MDTLIIGAGLGGLFTGALLSKQGVRVTVLEKNPTIGGGLQNFVRGGEMYETGMHVAGGFTPGDSLFRICSYLGIMDNLDIVRSDVVSSVTYADSGRTYDLPAGRDAFVEYLSGLFPEERKNLECYMDAIVRLSHEENLFYLESGYREHSEEFLMPADRFIAKYISNPELQALLAFVNPLYAGVPGHSPAYLHVMTSVLFIESPCRFGSGSSRLADELKRVIEQGGGQVLTRCEVAKVTVRDMHVTCVTDVRGREYAADSYVSAIHPQSLLDCLDGKAFTAGYSNRLMSIPDTSSAFKVFIRLKQGAVESPGCPVSVTDSSANVWKRDGDWPHTVCCFMSSNHMTVFCLMDFSEVSRWENTRTGHRGAEYEAWKKERTDRVLDLVEKRFPGIRQKADDIFAASPLTLRDWYGTKHAGAYGYFKDCENLVLSQVPVRTKVDNLFLTGQNVNMHGIGGVPMTAIETASAVLENDFILNDIKQIK